jgi:hypothetical protein
MTPPTAAFLDELRERARRYGWDGDYIPIRDFMVSLYRDAGVREPPNLEPYPICVRCDRVAPDCACDHFNLL